MPGRGAAAGLAATLALIGLSLLVSTLEQLRDRRRALTMLLVTALSLPPLWRLTRPDGVRTE